MLVKDFAIEASQKAVNIYLYNADFEFGPLKTSFYEIILKRENGILISETPVK